nr:translation initiation factor IF-3, mitochondrial isoform X2 [Scatophagus argus]XP_046228304.1 translation initiation factor IF-3, mitochondrial isoform X2 [Scatophagus argus]
MSGGCVRWMLRRTVRAVCGGSPGYWTPASRFATCSERHNVIATSWRCSPFSTAVGDAEQTPVTKGKKQDFQAPDTISSVGRHIPHVHIHLISDTGEDLGKMHRGDAIRIMEKSGLKLVLLNKKKDPPVYQLLSGKQIHEEQLKLREKQKTKAAPVQVKELTFHSGITTHDVSVKLKQVESWLEKKHHVRITLRSGRRAPAVNLDKTLEQMIQQMGVMVGFVSKPQCIRDGKAAMCILRPPSAKELSQKAKNDAAASRPADSSSKASPKETVSNTDTTEGPVQQ